MLLRLWQLNFRKRERNFSHIAALQKNGSHPLKIIQSQCFRFGQADKLKKLIFMVERLKKTFLEMTWRLIKNYLSKILTNLAIIYARKID